MVVEESIKIFGTQEAFRDRIQNKWEIVNEKGITYRNGGVGIQYKLIYRDNRAINMRVVFTDLNGFHVSDPSCNIENVFYFCDQLRKDFPELDGKLIFVSEHGEIVRFPFDCNDDELCRRIGLDDEFHDHDLMQEYGLE
ncbi:hypothetical protein [Pseudovibrio denitrificans]|uniref:hypothetical protein n=1 Tax=Pseudovibrio denitrificans TaxID=258256 RepID=UPI000FFB10F4|nr:hypothetical protein [Pseudovibrio denitrificans]